MNHPRTGLYVAGLALLGVGWVAAIASFDDPPETRVERRMRMRANPGKVGGMKATVTRIELNRAEGPHWATGRKAASSFVEAQKIIDKWAHTAPKNGTYDKTDFKITFSDGEKYDGRLDIKHPSVANDNDLARHVRTHLMIYSGQWQPPWMDDDRYARFLANLDPKDRKECAEFLKEHQIPSRTATARKNPSKRKPGKYPGFVIQTILVSKKYSEAHAHAIAEKHGGRPDDKTEETKGYWRFRQLNPKQMTKKYVSLKLPHATIVKALPKSVAKLAKISDTAKKLTTAERARLLKVTGSLKRAEAACR